MNGITINDVLVAITLLSVAFSVFLYFKNPQVRTEETTALISQALKNLQDNFLQFNKDFANLKDNHLHTMDLKMDSTNQAVTNLALTVTRLSTIIDERIPKK